MFGLFDDLKRLFTAESATPSPSSFPRAPSLTLSPELPEDWFVYDGAGQFTESGVFEFGVLIPFRDQRPIWLPGSTTDKDVIAQLQNAKGGEVFRDLGEDCGNDPLGITLHKIEMVTSHPSYQIIESRDPFLPKYDLVK